jgi:outer membrane protein assembly factor BamB
MSEHAMKIKFLCCLSLIVAAALASAQQPQTSDGGPAGGHGKIGWTQFGFDGLHGGYNAYETILNPSTVGKVALQWSYPAQYTLEGAPAVANGMVYFASGDNFSHMFFGLYALKADTGDLVWSITMSSPTFGAPAVANGVVYLIAGPVYAFDANTGSLLWQSRYNNCSFAPTLANGLVYAVCNSNVVYGFDAKTGTTVWSHATMGNIYAAPAVANGALYVSSGDGNVYAFRADFGALLWQKQFGASLSGKMNAYGGGQSIANGMLYVALPDYLYALDVNTGAVIWKLYGYYGGNTPTVGDGKAYVIGAAIYGLDASTGARIWQYPLPDGSFALTPVLAGGVVYTPIIHGIGFCVGTYDLTAFDAATGKPLWDDYTSLFCPYSSPTPAVANGTIYNYDGSGFGAFGLPNQ